MAAKVHKSLRLDTDLVERVERLKLDGEPLSNAMCRVMAVGCDTMEGVAQNEVVEHAQMMAGHRPEHDKTTAKLIELLERENARLVEEHENDQRRIEEKDRQIAQALEKSHELADQAHVLIGMAQEPKQLATGEGGGDIVNVEPVPDKISFREWWSKYR